MATDTNEAVFAYERCSMKASSRCGGPSTRQDKNASVSAVAQLSICSVRILDIIRSIG
jgi:hypothetical protein